MTTLEWLGNPTFGRSRPATARIPDYNPATNGSRTTRRPESTKDYISLTFPAVACGMAFPNVYTHRKVADAASKGCDVCYRPTTSVLLSEGADTKVC